MNHARLPLLLIPVLLLHAPLFAEEPLDCEYEEAWAHADGAPALEWASTTDGKDKHCHGAAADDYGSCSFTQNGQTMKVECYEGPGSPANPPHVKCEASVDCGSGEPLKCGWYDFPGYDEHVFAGINDGGASDPKGWVSCHGGGLQEFKQCS